MAESHSEKSGGPNLLQRLGSEIEKKFLTVKSNVSNRMAELHEKRVSDGAIAVVREALKETGLFISMLGIGTSVDVLDSTMKLVKPGGWSEKIQEKRDVLFQKGEEKAIQLGTIWRNRQKLVDAKRA